MIIIHLNRPGFQASITYHQGQLTWGDVIELLDSEAVKMALDEAQGKKCVGAFLLGMKKTTFVEKCRRYGIPRERRKSRTPKQGEKKR